MYTFQPGDRFQHYVVEALIGAGFHGEVYAIRHPLTGDRFALKVIRLAAREDASRVLRALNEARGTYSIQHKNVVQVFDLNCESDGLVWMRTELLRGQTLQALLALQGKLSALWALSAGIEAAWGLHAVHERQIIHRDVKPANLFYAEPRTIKVIDLSIAKSFREGLETTTGRAGLGTPAYSAPEQLEGAVVPDVRFDVYGLGMTLYELLSGKNPWAEVFNNTQELIRRQIEVMPPPLSEVARLPRRVDGVVMRAIAKDPAERYGSIMEMGRALFELRAWLNEEARAGRFIARKRMGEPAPPGDSDTERAYRPPEPTPVHSVPLPVVEPAPRVVLSEAVSEGDRPSDMANTLPVRKAGNYGGTVPIGDGVARTERGTELLPPAPASGTTKLPRQQAPAHEMVTAAPPSATRVTPPEVRRASSSSRATPHRLPWFAVALAVLLASASTLLAVVWWVTSARASRGSGAAVPAPSDSSAVTAPPRLAPNSRAR